MRTLYIGADPGKEGAFSAISDEGKVIQMIPMPINKDTNEMDVTLVVDFVCKALKAYDANRVIFVEEDVHPLYMVSAKSTASLMKNKGMIEATFKVMRLYAVGFESQFIYIAPKTWQKLVWNHTDKVFEGGKVNTKATSLNAFYRLFPGVSPLKNSRCTKAHDGMVDASLIAYAGMLKLRTN